MVDFILFFILIFGFLMGLKRGFILQAFHLIGFIIAFIIASLYYDLIAEKLSLWIPYPDLSDGSTWAAFIQSSSMQSAFYNAISFAVIFFAVKILLQIIASMLDFVASLPILRSLNKVAGAFLGFLEVYLILFIILFILALTPMATVQNWINDSSIALFIIEHTPYLSEKVKSLWFMELGQIFNSLS